MDTTSNSWDIGSHDPFPIEETWRHFVRQIGGSVVEDILPNPRVFENADFYFPDSGVIAELKEIETEFSQSQSYVKGFNELMERIVYENPTWRPVFLGGNDQFPSWFNYEFVRLFRPPISRILKKANRQIRDTKEFFKVQNAKGVLFLVNDGFQTLQPELILGLVANLLIHSYSSIDCFVYITANSYVAIPGDITPRLLWIPLYSDRAPNELTQEINELGRKWFNYIESLCGSYADRIEADDGRVIAGAKYITSMP